VEGGRWKAGGVAAGGGMRMKMKIKVKMKRG
jgi:hypothetical protein